MNVSNLLMDYCIFGDNKDLLSLLATIESTKPSVLSSEAPGWFIPIFRDCRQCSSKSTCRTPNGQKPTMSKCLALGSSPILESILKHNAKSLYFARQVVDILNSSTDSAVNILARKKSAYILEDRSEGLKEILNLHNVLKRYVEERDFEYLRYVMKESKIMSKKFLLDNGFEEWITFYESVKN